LKTALDLCCGRGGWAAGLQLEGWRVIGVDNNPALPAVYPGEFICADLLPARRAVVPVELARHIGRCFL
jgi:SAM-dependent methyltransferase